MSVSGDRRWCFVENPPQGRRGQECCVKGIIAYEGVGNGEDMRFGKSTITLGGSVIFCMLVKVPRGSMNLPCGYRNRKAFDNRQGPHEDGVAEHTDRRELALPSTATSRWRTNLTEACHSLGTSHIAVLTNPLSGHQSQPIGPASKRAVNLCRFFSSQLSNPCMSPNSWRHWVM